jgi:hypothetical protein
VIHTGQSGESLEVLVEALAEEEGGGSVIIRGVGDSVALADLDLAGESVDLDGEGSSNKGRAGDNALEETHLDDLFGWVGIKIGY